ncbi:uncharacterized protein LOC127620303 [Xyrauchen texanus]|uniref:uncharacterized protein LOC127620303 n=1 Tax=Xyrauchen texanus TaxID=154827 RepID=UPI002242C378|nr:uncharacterized protein LOC127620303 [Xyrauchen texanus]
MLRWISFLSMFSFVAFDESTREILVIGKKDHNVTLPCNATSNQSFDIHFYNRTKKMNVCQSEECNGPVFKSGNCDIVLKNVTFTDAGKYSLKIYLTDSDTVSKVLFDGTYQLQIDDETSVKKGDDLILDVVLSNADIVEHQLNTSSEWISVWKRGEDPTGRVTDINGVLNITGFTDSDAGIYRVLNSNEQILIKINVTENVTASGKESIQDNTTLSTRLIGVIVSVLVPVCVVIVIVVIYFCCCKNKYQSTNRSEEDSVNMENLN